MKDLERKRVDRLAERIGALPADRQEALMDELKGDKEVYTLAEVGEFLGLHTETVRRYLKAGSLRGAKLGKDWRVSRADLEAFYRERGGGALFGDETGER